TDGPPPPRRLCKARWSRGTRAILADNASFAPRRIETLTLSYDPRGAGLLSHPPDKLTVNLVVYGDEAEPVLRGETLMLLADDEQLAPWTRHDLTHGRGCQQNR